MAHELKYYKLEQRFCSEDLGLTHGAEWRYYSLYNGARGAWHHEKEYAIEEGEAHKALIIAILVRGKITSPQQLAKLGV